MLESAGYRATAFDSAELFLVSPERGATKCIITDIQLPGLDGFALKRRLDEERSTTPLIMYTARTDQHIEERVLASGAVCFLRKPFLPSCLFECVEQGLRRSATPS